MSSATNSPEAVAPLASVEPAPTASPFADARDLVIGVAEGKQRVVNQAFQAEKSAITGQAGAELEFRKSVDPLLKEAEEWDGVRLQAAKQGVERKAAAYAQLEKVHQVAAELATNQVRDRWADASTPVKIGAIAAMALGAFVQGVYGDKTNIAVDQIDAALKRDLAMQKLRYDQKADNLANQRTLLGEMRKLDADELKANNLAYIAGLQSVMHRIENLAKGSKDPRVAANAQKLMADIQMNKLAPAQMQLQEQMVGGLLRVGQMEQVAADRQAAAAQRAESLTLRQENMDLSKQRLGMKQNALTMRGTEGVGKSEKEMGKLREAQAQMSHLVDLYGKAKEVLREGPAAMSPFEWEQLMATISAIAKSEGIFNFGAALSGSEAEILKAAIGNKNIAYLSSEEGIKLLDKALNNFASQFREKVRDQRLTITKEHPFLKANE